MTPAAVMASNGDGRDGGECAAGVARDWAWLRRPAGVGGLRVGSLGCGAGRQGQGDYGQFGGGIGRNAGGDGWRCRLHPGGERFPYLLVSGDIHAVPPVLSCSGVIGACAITSPYARWA
jgi:hypothetical protein